MPETSSDTILVPPDLLSSLILSVLTSPTYKVPKLHADIVANAMLLADLTGHDTHGSQRLPSYLKRIREGVMDASASPVVTNPAPAVAAVDGKNTFGHVAIAVAMDAAIGLAKTYGVGMGGVKHSNHFGAASWIVERATQEEYAAIVFTNSSPALPPFGGREKLLGVSPLAAGFPGFAENDKNDAEVAGPFILDMAPSVAARGKVIKALRRGEKIPEGWALDEDGEPTTDPEAALRGTMLPMGGPKGSALAVLMDVFSGVMTGAAFAGSVASPYDSSRQADVGHFLIVMKPDLFLNRHELNRRLMKLRTTVTESEPAAGVERVRFPGQREAETRETRKAQGIPFTRQEIDVLNDEAHFVGVKPLSAELDT